MFIKLLYFSDDDDDDNDEAMVIIVMDINHYNHNNKICCVKRYLSQSIKNELLRESQTLYKCWMQCS